eukprot:jgi/Galph1/2985/GphlegSOOS_G1648.1
MDSSFYCERPVQPSFSLGQFVNKLFYKYAFFDSCDLNDPTPGLAARPVVCFAGHMNGAGKTTLGKRFRDILVINKEYISKQDRCAIPEESLDALYNLTLCVYLDLIAFSQEGTHFEYIFYENICKSALSEFPNAAELLSEVLPLILHRTSRWLPKLLRVINQKYLYL